MSDTPTTYAETNAPLLSKNRYDEYIAVFERVRQDAVTMVGMGIRHPEVYVTSEEWKALVHGTCLERRVVVDTADGKLSVDIYTVYPLDGERGRVYTVICEEKDDGAGSDERGDQHQRPDRTS